jgi:transposase
MLLPFNAEIFFYPKPVDFRKQMNGLTILIADTLAMNPTSGQIFIFRNRGYDRLKVLYWDKNGFWLLYRRLESGKFCFPKIDDSAMSLTSEQFQWLLSGLNIADHKPIKTQNFSYFF